MKAKIKQIVIIFILSSLLLPAFSLSSHAEVIKELKNLRSEIFLLNLINGLYLSDTQIEQLIDLISEAKTEDENYKEKLNVLSEDVSAKLNQLRAVLAEQEEPSDDLKKEVFDVKNNIEILLENRGERLDEFTNDILRVFTENQIAVINKFSPCLILPKTKDDIRIGQANDNSGIVRFLSKSRELPDSTFDYYLDRASQKYITKLEEKSNLPFDTDEEKERFKNAVFEARLLSDLEFELEKEELAESISLDRYKAAHSMEKQSKLIAKLFLSPDAQNVLQERLGKISNE